MGRVEVFCKSCKKRLVYENVKGTFVENQRAQICEHFKFPATLKVIHDPWFKSCCGLFNRVYVSIELPCPQEGCNEVIKIVQRCDRESGEVIWLDPEACSHGSCCCNCNCCLCSCS